MLGARLRTSGGWSLTGITVMMNFSVTPLRGEATYNEEREVEEAENMEGSEKKAGVEEEEEGAEGAAQARKVKLSLMVSESSWV